MKKCMLLLAGLFSFSTLHAHSQLGIQLMPGAAFSKVLATTQTGEKDSPSSPITSGPFSGQFQAGAIYDYPLLQDNSNLSTGVFYLAQRFIVVEDGQTKPYELNYLQVPMLLKLYTNEVALDVKLYVKIGPVLQFNPGSFSKITNPQSVIEQFSTLGAGGILGGGVELETGFSTSVFIGISYQKGLSNIVRTSNERYSDLRGHSNLLSIDFGIRS